MITHTPGPWRLTSDAGLWSATHDDIGTSAYTAIRACDETVVALAVAEDPQPFSSPETRGNARLIAAAPELLEALQGMKTVMEIIAAGPNGKQFSNVETRLHSFVHVTSALVQAEQAIAKATGA